MRQRIAVAARVGLLGLASQGLLSLGLLSMAGCKPDIPKEYDDFVVEKDLRKFLPKEKSALDGAGGTMFYKTTDTKALSQSYRDKLDGAGYKSMMKCEDSDVVVAVKGDNMVVSLSFMPLGDETMVNMTKAKMSSVGFPEKKKCEWTDAAKKACEVREDYCYFKDS